MSGKTLLEGGRKSLPGQEADNGVWENNRDQRGGAAWEATCRAPISRSTTGGAAGCKGGWGRVVPPQSRTQDGGRWGLVGLACSLAETRLAPLTG